MTAGGGVAYWPWLGLLGALVSDAKDRDSSSADQAARVNATHSELFDVLVEREKKVAELIAADREYDEARLAFFNCRLGDIDAADAARDAATSRRASALAALDVRA